MIKKTTVKIRYFENEIFQAFPAGSERVNMSFPWVSSRGKNLVSSHPQKIKT